MSRHLWQLSLAVFLLLATGGMRAPSSAAAPLWQSDDIPPAPIQDIPVQETWPEELLLAWQTGGVADIEAAFNLARQAENQQLGLSLPMLQLPNQSEWDTLSDGEKALWLINRERIDRGVSLLQGVEENVTAVAQGFAEYLVATGQLGHDADGLSPHERLAQNARLGDCHDPFTYRAENAILFWLSSTAPLTSTISPIPLSVERAIYVWMYEDGLCCDWAHRATILQNAFNDNSGDPGMEGFLGIGRAGRMQEISPERWKYEEIVVMNFFDPCQKWDAQDQFTAPTVRLYLPLLSRKR